MPEIETIVLSVIGGIGISVVLYTLVIVALKLADIASNTGKHDDYHEPSGSPELKDNTE